MLDHLTSLPSRTGFFEELNKQVHSSSSKSSKIACLIININKLKKINASLGYDSGDILLQQFAQRIQGMLRESDTAARIGDNRFALILTSIMNSGHATLAANKILTLLEDPFNINGILVRINATMGLALYPEHGDNAQSLLHNSEAALEQARSSRDKYIIYSRNNDNIVQRSHILEKELKDAIDGDELEMHYQPQISIHQQTVNSVEALVRWQHPETGVISPDRFISLAENCGLIVPLTLWTLNTTLRHCKPFFDHWQDFCVSVNLSAVALHESDLVEMIRQSMQIWGISPNKLTLEVTESAMMIDPESSMQTLHRLNDLGVNVSIDDFGTGHSSLAYLKQLPVNEIKIDKSFVMNMSENNEDRKIVRSVIDLGHNFGLQVVAEGIESEQTLSELRGMGCDIGQGYYISRPLPMNEMLNWIYTTTWNNSKKL
jgi:diguanylate cyclase (GGDEF)-like protein